MKSTFVYLLTVILLCSCYTQNQSRYSSNTHGDMPNEPGKCYAKCLMPDEVAIEQDTMGSFSVDEEIPEDMLTYQEVTETRTKWVKKKTNNCHSSNPDDCLVWCLQEVPSETITRQSLILLDTMSSEPIMYVVNERAKIVSDGGYTEWKEVLCANKISSRFYSDARMALIALDYTCESNRKKDVSIALQKFQKDNRLPIGQLDMETLEALGLR